MPIHSQDRKNGKSIESEKTTAIDIEKAILASCAMSFFSTVAVFTLGETLGALRFTPLLLLVPVLAFFLFRLFSMKPSISKRMEQAAKNEKQKS